MLAYSYPLLRPLLFALDPEVAHDWSLASLGAISRSPFKGLLKQTVTSDPYQVFGLKFPNRVGLAAGLDKNGAFIDAFAAMGFGFIEVGTVTPKPQPGNPKPRMFRLSEHQAIINRMGFNNYGVDQLIANVQRASYNGVLGINIGKNKSTPEDQAVNDYLFCMEKVFPYADYITVNISSPNTPGLRALQFGEPLDQLLAAVTSKQQLLQDSHQKQVPVLIKIAPDLELEEIKRLADGFNRNQVDGVIATNTTLDRKSVAGHKQAEEAGGLSGRVLFNASTDVLRHLRSHLDKAIPIVGVGGIDSGESAKGKIAAGADLVQIYSGFIYQGPALIKQASDAIRMAK